TSAPSRSRSSATRTSSASSPPPAYPTTSSSTPRRWRRRSNGGGGGRPAPKGGGKGLLGPRGQPAERARLWGDAPPPPPPRGEGDTGRKADRVPALVQRHLRADVKRVALRLRSGLAAPAQGPLTPPQLADERVAERPHRVVQAPQRRPADQPVPRPRPEVPDRDHAHRPALRARRQVVIGDQTEPDAAGDQRQLELGPERLAADLEP